MIVLAAVSWGQERLWQTYGAGAQASDDAAGAPCSRFSIGNCTTVPSERRADFVADAARDTGLDLELLEPQDIAGAASDRRPGARQARF